MSKKRIRKPGSGVVLVAFVALTALAFLQCAPDIGLPSWDIKMTLPFSQQRYGLDSLISRPDEVAEDNGGIDTLDGGMLRFFHIEPFDSVNVADSLLEMDTEDTTDYPVIVGTLTMDSTEMVESRISAAALVPGFSGDDYYDFTPLVIPQSARASEMDNFDSLSVAHVIDPNGGNLFLQLYNNTNLNWTEVVADIHINETGYPQIGTVTFYNVGAGQTQVEYTDLSGDTLKESLILFVEGYGNDTTGVYVSSENGLEFSSWINDLQCDYVYGFIGKQNPVYDTTITEFEDEDNWIVRAYVEYGIINVNVRNMTNTEDSVYIKIPSFVSAADTTDTLQLDFFLEPLHEGLVRSSRDTILYLEDMLMTLELPEGYDTPTPANQSIDYFSKVVVLGGGRDAFGRRQEVEIRSEDSVFAQVIVEEFDFDWLWGVVKDERIDLDSIDIEINSFEDNGDLQRDLSGNFRLEDAQILIDLSGSTVESPAKLVMDVTAINTYLPAGEQEMTEQFIRWISPGQDTVYIGGPNDDDPRVTQLMNHLPNQLMVAGDVRIGRDHLSEPDSPWDPYQPYPLRSDDMVVGSVILEAPLQLSIENGTPIHAEIDSIGEGFESGLRSMNMRAVVSNTIPLGGQLYLIAGSFANESIADNALQWANVSQYLIAGPVNIPIPEIDQDTRRAVEAIADTVHLEVGADAMSILTSDSLFMRQILYVEPTDGYIAAYESDAINISIIAEVEYRVNEEDDE